MDALEIISPVKRLKEGECPCCGSRLHYNSLEVVQGTLEKNGMIDSGKTTLEAYLVYCEKCGYENPAIQIGLKIIPEDRIFEYDRNWDKKYLEDNTIVFGKEGENPFSRKEKE